MKLRGDAKAERLLMEVFQGFLISRLLNFKAAYFQGRVTYGAVLAKADGGCFGIRRFPALQNV